MMFASFSGMFEENCTIKYELLQFIGHMKNNLWLINLFRCESISLKTHWVMVVMDHFTRRIIGFATYKGDITGIDIC